MYNKFWEWNNGNKSWVEITAERFDRTINPAVFIPDGRYQDLKMRNLPNIQIEKDAWSYYSVTKTFPCGRKYTWKERNLLGLISDSFKFANFEDIEFHRLREEKEQLEKRYNELLKRLDQLSNDLSWRKI